MESEEIEMLTAILGEEAVSWNPGGEEVSVCLSNGLLVRFAIGDGYPSVAPLVTFSDQSLEGSELQALLMSEANTMLGSPMIFQLAETAQSWIESSYDDVPLSRNERGGVKVQVSSSSCEKNSRPHVDKSDNDLVRVDGSLPKYSNKLPDKSSKICRFFLSGKCKFGDRCNNLHTKQVSSHPKPTSEMSLYDEMVSRDRLRPGSNHADDKSKVASVSEDDSDPNSDSHQDFDDGRPSDETSTTKRPMKQAIHVIHRILWDDQLPSEHFTVGYLDRFVGIIEKPFRAFSWEDLASVGHDVLAIPKHRIQYFKYKDVIVWDKRVLVDEVFGSRGSTRTILDVMKEVDGEKGSCEPVEKVDSVDSSDSDLDPEDVEDDVRPSKMGIYKAKADKNRPTHFIYIPVFGSKEIVSKAKELQDHVVEHDPRFSDGRLPLENLHVSVGYVRLEKEVECQHATRVLKELQPYFATLLPPSEIIHSEGVDTFRDRLIFAKVTNFQALVRFVTLLLKRFQAAGISTPGNHEPYVPHITLLRLRRPMMREMNESTIPEWLYKPFKSATFGDHPIQELKIGEMADFYVRYRFSISNCALNLSALVPPLVSQAVRTLSRFGAITEGDLSQVEDILEHYQSGQDGEKVLKAERAVENIRKHMKRILEGRNKSLSAEDVEAASCSIVVILRGLPGSGKSWLADHCEEMREDPASVAICSADNFFVNRQSGQYQFDPDLLPQAHQQCLQDFLAALWEKKKIVIVDNTNVHHWEYLVYQYLSQLLGYRHFILEVPCSNEKVAEMYASRNQHRVPIASVMKMYSSWEEERSAVVLPPSVVNPYQPTTPWSYSIADLCLGEGRLLRAAKEYGYPLSIMYTGVYLTPESRWSILSLVPPLHPTVYTDHVTLVFHPSLSQAGRLPLGKKKEVTPLGWASNNDIQALAVRLPPDLHSANAVPHITISTEHGVSPKYSNDLLQCHPPLTPFPPVGFQIEGRVGMVIEFPQSSNVDRRLAGKSFHVFSHEEFQSLLPFIKDHPAPPLHSAEMFSSVSIPKPLPSPTQDGVSILSGHQKITKLFVFDFDGTLFNTPHPEGGRAMYEKLTGKQWPYARGWNRWPESLFPPLVSHPGPALPHYNACFGQSGSLTVLLTGRLLGTREAVLAILYQHSVYPEQCFFKDTPVQETTPAYKTRTVGQLLQNYPDVNYVKVFDDLDDVLFAFRQFAKQKTNIQFDIIDSKTLESCYPRTQPSGAGVVETALRENGRIPLPLHRSAAEAGIHFISSQWAHLVQFKGPPENLVLPFGSYVLGRRGDVDLCLLSPPSLSHFECVDQLANQLEACGTVYVHRGYSSRCPCVKLMLQYGSSANMKFDVVFFVVYEKGFFDSLQLSRPSLSSLKTQMVAGNAASKAAITGPIFLQHVIDRIDNQIPIHEFGMAVEMAVWFIQSQRLKGNALSCMRTFHIVQTLADLVHKGKEGNLSSSTSKADWLFSSFVSKATAVNTAKWEHLFGETVPAIYVPKLQDAFKCAERSLHEQFGGNISRDYIISIIQRPAFPPPGFKSVAIQFESGDKKIEWELETILEARMPTYIRQLIMKGLDIQPSGNDISCGCVTFAVRDRDTATETVNSVFKPLWNELERYRKNQSVCIRLVFDHPFPQSFHPRGAPSQRLDVADAEVLQKVNDFAAQNSTAKSYSLGGSVELHLPSSLTSYQRLLVHQRAEQLGLNHVSVGVGPERHVLVSLKIQK
jgi:2'-5' RNA ligase